MPIIGTIASSRRAFTIEGSIEPIASVVVPSGGLSSITFGNIPQTYTHLQLRGIARSTRAANDGYIVIQFNGDSSNVYARHNLYGDGTSAGSDGTASIGACTIYYMPGANASANIFGAFVADILDYANTNKNKTIRGLSGNDRNGSGLIGFHSGLWANTSAITSITITEFNAFSWAQFSSFALYGIKGA